MCQVLVNTDTNKSLQYIITNHSLAAISHQRALKPVGLYTLSIEDPAQSYAVNLVRSHVQENYNPRPAAVRFYISPHYINQVNHIHSWSFTPPGCRLEERGIPRSLDKSSLLQTSSTAPKAILCSSSKHTAIIRLESLSTDRTHRATTSQRRQTR